MNYNGYAIQWVWIKGWAVGFLYYDHYMEVTNGNMDIEEYDPEDYYQVLDFCFLIFAIKITIW
jgi:hypothetical protein|tara:strand:+ start:2720 stop:2908 length:189 start_codon:yes stop_codon:yes gene_type:complete